MEATDSSGFGAPCRSRKLLCSSENVPVAIFLPTEPGVQFGPCSRTVFIQRTHGDTSGSPEAARTQSSAAGWSWTPAVPASVHAHVPALCRVTETHTTAVNGSGSSARTKWAALYSWTTAGRVMADVQKNMRYARFLKIIHGTNLLAKFV